jgi:hypothetical protein
MAWMVPIGLWVADKVMGFYNDDDDDVRQVSNLTPTQRKTQRQLERAIQGKKGGGVYGDIADYYRDLMSPDSKNAAEMFAPEQRKFNEQTIPDLAEQFAGMGSGNLSSSGFQNATVGAGTDLSERLAAMRSNLRMQGATGLANLGRQSLQPVVTNTMNSPNNDYNDAAGGFGSAATDAAMEYYRNSKSQSSIKAGQDMTASTRNTSPYGKQGQKLGVQPQTSGNYNLPTFGGY